MAKYRIFVKASAAKEIEKIRTKRDRRRIVKKIRSLSDNPRPRGSVKLSGKDKYRLRQGNYRIIYSIEDDKLIVHIVKVGHRKDVYRN
ncbi:MAG: type II toxin-antitoxin system mRNA interferase toxin, RelE/StbE family [Candidatus Latescibacteria bacterium]|nr:type II toxin-antitoxin system mRNA interferase toxin, RelE/StbE family [Candidatus Latescibacterota bacterium]